ncbi:MAG: hypothetical protein ABF321_09975 [Bacteroidia bacterium]
MKNILTTALLLVCALTAIAQEAMRKQYVNPAQVVGVYNFGRYAAALSNEGVRAMDQKQLYTLHFLAEGIANQEIAVPTGSSIFNVESSANNSAIIFNGRNEVTVVMIADGVDPEYVTIETAESFNYNRINTSAIDDKGNIVLVRNYSQNGVDENGRQIIVERGLEYIHLAADGTVTFKRLEKQNIERPFNLVNIFPTSSGMVYLMEYNGRKKSEYELKLNICDDMGNPLGEYTLTNEQTFFPSDIINDNGKLVMAGYYLNGTIYSSKKTEGLFMTILDASGTEQSKSIFDWDNMKQKLKDAKRSEFIFNGKMNVMIEKIAVTDLGYSIIGESYSTGSGITGAEFLIGGNSSEEMVLTVYDFVLFETDANGGLLNVSILEKEECNIEMAGTSRRMGMVQMTSLLKKFDVLPFRGVENGVISFVNYKAKKGYYATMNTSTGEISEGKPLDINIVKEEVVDKDAEALVAGSSALTKLDRMGSKLDKFATKTENAINKLEYGIEKVDVRFSPYAKSETGQHILSDGKLVSYQLDQKDYSIYYDYLN